MKSSEQATARLPTAEALEQIRMRPDELRDAKSCLHQADIFAEVLMRAYSAVLNLFGVAGHDVGTIQHHG